MRRILLFLLLVIALPVEAQSRPIAPAPSELFRRAMTDTTPVDTVKVDTGIPQPLGRMIGLIGGAAVGYLFARINEGGGATYDCALSCTPPDHPVERRMVSATIFGLLGFWVVGELTGPKVSER